MKSSFAELVRQAHGGDESAARALHDVCQSRLLRAVRRRLPQKLRSLYDSMDFTQDVWSAYWKRYRNRKDFPHAKAFAALLMRIADGIVIDAVRQRLMRGKHNANREEQLRSPNSDGALDFADPQQQTPSQVFMRREVWNTYLDKTSEQNRRILELFEQGWKTTQIADQVGLDRRTVKRVILNMIEDITRQNQEFWSE